MPDWLYSVPPRTAALIMVIFIESLALIGLVLVRRFLIPRLQYHDGANDAVSGTVQAIGVFYGITVGLIAVGVWNTNSNAADLVSKEAAAIGSLFRDVSGYPSPLRDELRAKVREYTVFVINDAWPAQQRGQGQAIDRGSYPYHRPHHRRQAAPHRVDTQPSILDQIVISPQRFAV